MSSAVTAWAGCIPAWPACAAVAVPTAGLSLRLPLAGRRSSPEPQESRVSAVRLSHEMNGEVGCDLGGDTPLAQAGCR